MTDAPGLGPIPVQTAFSERLAAAEERIERILDELPFTSALCVVEEIEHRMRISLRASSCL